MRNLHVQNLRKHWDELEEHGVPLELPEFRRRSGGRDFHEELFIEQQGDIASNLIIESDKYHIYYILNLLIINRLPGAVHVLEKSLGLPWDDAYFEWLPDPAVENRSKNPSKKLYIFPGPAGEYYPRSIVLNHVLRGPLRRGVPHEGLLLGIGRRPIPNAFQHGAKIDVSLTLVDQWTRQHSVKLAMYICRAEGSRSPKRQREKRSYATLCDTAAQDLNR
jgi:hypothetical protein